MKLTMLPRLPRMSGRRRRRNLSISTMQRNCAIKAMMLLMAWYFNVLLPVMPCVMALVAAFSTSEGPTHNLAIDGDTLVLNSRHTRHLDRRLQDATQDETPEGGSEIGKVPSTTLLHAHVQM